METLEFVATATGGRCVGDDATFTGTTFTGVTQDTRQLAPGDLYVALRGPNFDGHSFVRKAASLGAAAALVDTPVAGGIPQVVVPDTLQGLQRLASAWRARFTAPVVAVTGSNGKTTVKQMLHAVLAQQGEVLATQGNLNNHIGVPLTLLRLRATHVAAVIEMGCSKPGDIAELAAIARPDAGAVTNAAGAHLQGLGSLDGVARTKGELFAGLTDDGTAVINNDDAYTDLWRGLAGSRRVLNFGLGAGNNVYADALELTPTGSAFDLHVPGAHAAVRLPLPGRHNVANALATAALAHALSVPVETIASGLARVQPATGRLTRRVASNGAVIIDDSYNANPASLAAALDVLATAAEPRWLVLGDMNELGESAADEHRAAGVRATAAGVNRLFTIGDLAGLAGDGFGAGASHHASMEALIDAVRADLAANVTVLIKGSRGARLERLVQALTADAVAGVGSH